MFSPYRNNTRSSLLHVKCLWPTLFFDISHFKSLNSSSFVTASKPVRILNLPESLKISRVHHFSFTPNMKNLNGSNSNLKIDESNSVSFSYFPEDVQLCILSFLTPSEISNFACTSKRHVLLCQSDDKLWYAMCDRRWGSKTQIKKWGNGKIPFKFLFNTLSKWENLIGFWRKTGHGKIVGNGFVTGGPESPPLIFFEWGSSFITGFRVSPSKCGTYHVIKSPFLWMSLTPDCQSINFLDPEGRHEFLPEDFANTETGSSENELIPVNVSFMGSNHVVVEENFSFGSSSGSSVSAPEQAKKLFKRSLSSSNLRVEDMDVIATTVSGSPGSLPDRYVSDIYQYFANRTSPGAERRRQRRREKERQGRKKWEPEHFVKIVNCSPTPARPLQGLWKGICDDMNLDFFLVVYDDVGGIACRRVGDSCKPFSSYSPVFWTSNTTFIESPLSPAEEYIYDSRLHLQPFVGSNDFHKPPIFKENETISRILYINSSYDLVIPDLAGTVDPRHVEGRIWQYGNGTFGFGFLRDNFIIDLKCIAKNGSFTTELSSD